MDVEYPVEGVRRKAAEIRAMRNALMAPFRCTGIEIRPATHAHAPHACCTTHRMRCVIAWGLRRARGIAPAARRPGAYIFVLGETGVDRQVERGWAGVQAWVQIYCSTTTTNVSREFVQRIRRSRLLHRHSGAIHVNRGKSYITCQLCNVCPEYYFNIYHNFIHIYNIDNNLKIKIYIYKMRK